MRTGGKGGAAVAASRDHGYNEARSLWLRRAIARRLRDDPAPVLARAAANADHMLRVHGRSVEPYAGRWLGLLSGPVADLAALMVSDTQEARDLRQCTPFAGALSPHERWAVYRDFQKWWSGVEPRAT